MTVDEIVSGVRLAAEYKHWNKNCRLSLNEGTLLADALKTVVLDRLRCGHARSCPLVGLVMKEHIERAKMQQMPECTCWYPEFYKAAREAGWVE